MKAQKLEAPDGCAWVAEEATVFLPEHGQKRVATIIHNI